MKAIKLEEYRKAKRIQEVSARETYKEAFKEKLRQRLRERMRLQEFEKKAIQDKDKETTVKTFLDHLITGIRKYNIKLILFQRTQRSLKNNP